MCCDYGDDNVHPCRPYRLGAHLGERWAAKGPFNETAMTRIRELMLGPMPFVVNIDNAAEEIFYRIRPLVSGNREAAAWFWLHEVGAEPDDLKSDPHFYTGFIDDSGPDDPYGLFSDPNA